MSEGNMKPKNQPISDQEPDLTDDQKRDQATRNFMHPEDKVRPPQKSWWSRNLVGLLIVLVLVAGGTGFGIYKNAKSHEPIPVPETFDPSSLKSVIGANDSTQMTWDEYTATAPQLWVEENKTMTAPVPILYKDNRTPTLSIKKIESSFDHTLNRISIDGLEPGDTVLSLIDGEIEITEGHEKDLAIFTLFTQDSQGNDTDIMYLTSGLEIDPSIIFDKPVKDHIRIPIKKDQPIGKMLTADNFELIGWGPLIENFNLAVTPGKKAILLK
jgi:hypothetical protein